MQIINGDITDCDQITHIVQQCNCTTKYGLGLSKAIFTKYPIANDYENNHLRYPGTINIYKVDTNKYVVNMFAQRSPGKPNNNETRQMRLNWFKSCLDELYRSIKAEDAFVIGFPFTIGCGLAGGNWKDYLLMLENFEKLINANTQSKVLIVKLDL